MAALLLALVLAVPAGVLAATKRGTRYDRLVMGVVLVGQSVPTFWLGMMMILVVAVRLHLLPVSGRGTVLHLIMPAIALSLWLVALLARVTRSEMLEVLAQDTSGRRARREIWSPVSRGGTPPQRAVAIITVVGLQFGGLLGAR